MEKLTLLRWGCYCLLAICSTFSFSFAQRKKSTILQYDQTAYDGKVFLADSSVIRGGIVFKDNDGIVTVINGDDSRSFNARGFVKFEYYDEMACRHKRFYSLEFDDPETGLRDMQIFEVMKELPSFAVLCRIDRIKTEVRRGPMEPPASPLLVDRKNKKFTQTETIFIVSSDGDFQAYVRWVKKEIGGDLLDYNENNTWVLDPDLLREYTEPYYSALEDFAKMKKLKFKRKADLIQILDEYERLLQQ